MNDVSFAHRLCKVPGTLLIACLAVVAFTSEGLAGVLEYHLHQQNPFPPLSLLGCHLLHWSSEHLFWDLSMFVVLGIVCERWLPRAFYSTLLLSSLLIPLAVMWSAPDIDVYRGLSGLDTAIFSLLVSSLGLQAIHGHDRWQAVPPALLLLALWTKIAFEFHSGQVLFVQQVNFTPLPIAHAIGGLVGAACAWWTTIRTATHASLGDPLANQIQRCLVDAKRG